MTTMEKVKPGECMKTIKHSIETTALSAPYPVFPQRMAFLRIVLTGILCTQAAGCVRGMSDLYTYVAQVKSREAPGIKPLPEIKPYRHFAYVDQNRRNPFDSSIFESKVAEQAARNHSDPTIRPDTNRTAEFLENFPLDSLRMVGTLSQDGQLWALIKTPDKTIQRVSYGDYMGQNNGRIRKISDSGIDLAEIVPDGYGGWRERKSYVAFNE